MNTSQFMDKQILDLMSPQSQPQLQEESLTTHINGDTPTTKEEILASYDFQPIRTVSSSPPRSGTSSNTVTSAGPSSTWGSLDSRMASSNLKSAGLLEPQVLKEVTRKEERTVPSSHSAVTIAEIDRTVKKYADNLLHALEGVTARLSQLESRTNRMENSMDDLKLVIGNNTGARDGKLRQFENILREVQSGVQILRDKQEIMETQVHLSKLQPQPQSQSQSKTSSHASPDPDTSFSLPPPPQQPQLQAPQAPPQAPPLQTPSLPTPNAPSPPLTQYPPQNQNPSVPALPAPNAPQYPPQITQSAPPSVPPYFPSQQQPMDPAHQQSYHQPPQSQPQPQPQQGPEGYQQGPSHPHVQPPQYPPYSPSPMSQPPPEEIKPPYGPPPAQQYPPRGPAPPYMQQPPSSGPVPPSFYGPPPPTSSSSGMYNEPPPTNRPGYGPPVDPYQFGGGSPSYRGGPGGMKPNSPFASGSVGGGGKYENLPTAKVLPQAAPVGPGSGSGNRVPLDDVVEKVAMMGFSRDQVRATVRKLTENGQNVDLNIVLDKLMNDGAGGDMIQPQKGWYR